MPKSAAKSSAKPSTAKLLERFKEGDFIFGLDKARATLVSELQKKGFSFVKANEVNTPVIKNVINKTKEDELNLSSRLLEHYRFLFKKRHYLTKPGGKPLANTTFTENVGIAVRRACKLILKQSRKKTYRIHFELDGINLERVCKSDSNDLGITNSELKALYRQAKAGKKNPNLFFYLKGESCEAPWMNPENKKLFEEYDERRKNKGCK